MLKTAQNDQISAFLADPSDFAEGLRLYERWGDNQALKAIFRASGATEYNHRKLVEALQGLAVGRQHRATEPSATKPSAPLADPADGRSAPRPRWIRSVADGSVYAVAPNHPDLIKRYRQRAMWKSQITLLPTQEERRELAFAILDLTDEIESILYNGFSKTGRCSDGSPGDGNALPEDRAELAKRLTTNGKYISKYRNRADKAEEINRRRAENEQIVAILEKTQCIASVPGSPS